MIRSHDAIANSHCRSACGRLTMVLGVAAVARCQQQHQQWCDGTLRCSMGTVSLVLCLSCLTQLATSLGACVRTCKRPACLQHATCWGHDLAGTAAALLAQWRAGGS